MSDIRSISIPSNPLPDPYTTYDQIVITPNILNDPNIDETLKTQAQRIEERLKNPNLSRIPINQLRTNIEMSLKARGITLAHKPNLLDEYPTSSYKLKFCVVSDRVADMITTHEQWDQTPKEVIAESGVTVGFNIRSFEIENLCGPSYRIGLALQTNWKMTLAEPYGLSFIDRLYTLTKSMGISNHIKCKYFMELKFTGEQEDGAIADISSRQLYRLIITDITATSNEGGTTYELEGLFDNSGPSANQISMPTGQVKIENVSTMGEFFDKLATTLNEHNKNLDYNVNGRRIEYFFKMPESWRNWKLIRTSRDPARSTGFDVEYNDTATISFNRTSISEILVSVMSITEEGIRFVLGQTGTTQNGQSRSQAQGINLAPIIDATLDFVAYDTYTKTYSMRVTYYFSEYPTTQGYSTPESIAYSQQENVQAQRLQSMIQEGRVNKIYNFIFTGLNTDIINFELSLSNYWAALQPKNLGENTIANFSLPPQVGNQSVAIDINNEYRKARQNRENARVKLDELVNRAKNDKSAELQKLINDANAALTTATATFRLFQNFDRTTFEIQFPTQSAGQQAESGIIINNRNVLNNKDIREQVLTAAIYDKIRKQTANKDRYLEDVVPTSPVSTPLPISSYTTNAPLIQNVSMGAEARTDESIGPNGERKPRSRGLLATTLDNVVAGDFLNINLEIRGDPYWLGIDNVISSGLKRVLKPAPPKLRSVSAAFGNGEIGFVLFFVTGDEPNSETGYVDFAKTSWAFNGLYVAREVRSTFREGKFTQVITAAKDAAMFSVFNDLAPINQPPPPVTSDEVRRTTR